MTSYNVYEKLYNNTRANFMIAKGDEEYTLGEYMMMKAGKKCAKSKLPVAKTASNTGKAVSAFFSFVNDKLTIKTPPAKDKTIKRFPMRTSVAAFLSAVLVSTLALSFALFSANSIAFPSTTTEKADSSEVSDTDFSDVNE